MNLKNILYSSLVFVLLLACDGNKVYQQSIEVSDGVWDRSEVARFEFEIDDMEEYYHLFVNIRNSGKYPYSNLYLFITLTAPDGKFHKDTLECVLADKAGKWLGEGFGDVWSHKVPFKKGVLFAKEGKFTVQIEQAMRKEELPGIVDVGFTVERVKNKPSENTLKQIK